MLIPIWTVSWFSTPLRRIIWYSCRSTLPKIWPIPLKVVVPLQARCSPEGSRRFRLPDFHDIWHMKVVRLSASLNGRLYPQEIFLVLIFTRGWVDPRAMVRSEGDISLKNPVTPPGIDPGTVRLVAQPLKHYATQSPWEIRGANPVVARSKAQVCCRPLAGTAGSNPSGARLALLNFVCCVCRGFCNGPITHPVVSYRVCVNECAKAQQ